MARAILIIGAGALLVGVWVYALFDLAQAERERVRTLPKWAWALIAFLVPLVGSVLWFVFGRPRSVKRGGRGASGSALRAPDDDPDYLRFLEQQEKRRRESEARKKQEDEGEEDQS